MDIRSTSGWYLTLREYPTDCTFVLTKYALGKPIQEIEFAIEGWGWKKIEEALVTLGGDLESLVLMKHRSSDVLDATFRNLK